MAAINTINALKIGSSEFQVKPCWEQLGLTQDYMVALLSRDEYTPVATKQPTSTDTMYTDPVSGNLAGIHAGQCVIYPDADAPEGWGLSIAKKVVTGNDGVPTAVAWFHATEMQKRMGVLEQVTQSIYEGCFGAGTWENVYPWQSYASWNNGTSEIN